MRNEFLGFRLGGENSGTLDEGKGLIETGPIIPFGSRRH
jgi:hypothetical protein